MKKIFSLIFIMLSIGAAAQTHVSGTVTDAATGESLIGASVYVEGTTVGAATDLDGHYDIMVPEGKNLVFEYIGYKTVTEPVDGRSVIDIALGADTNFLDEVVVVGYSVMKRRDVLGAVSKVGGEELVKVPVSSV